MPLISEVSLVQSLISSDSDESESFHVHYRTRYLRKLSEVTFRRTYLYNTNPHLLKRLANHNKTIANVTCIQLPIVNENPAMSLVEALQLRQSTREFSGEAISLSELACLLLNAYGAQAGNRRRRRTAPSGGGRYPIEIYPVVLNVRDVEAGVYHYNVKDKTLELVRAGDQSEALMASAMAETSLLKNTAVVLILTAIFRRTTEKYGQHGWRVIFMDAGHVGENIGLLTTALQLASCANAGGYDRPLCELLKISESSEGPVVSYLIGRPLKTIKS